MRDSKVGGARPVLDLGRDLQQRHHLLEVGQRLLDIAIDHAEEVERLVQLQQVGVDQHKVADRHAAGRNPLRGEDHNADEAAGDDRALADIQ